MSTLGRTRIRLAGDAANFNSPLDVNSRATPQFWRGNDVQFEIAVFFNGVLQSVANLASMTLEIRVPGPAGGAPDPSTTPLMSATVYSGTFDDTTTEDTWSNGTQQQALIPFTAAQSNIAAGPQWLSLWVVTTDNPSRVITLTAGPIRVLEDGCGPTATAPSTSDSYYTEAEVNALLAGKLQVLALAALTGGTGCLDGQNTTGKTGQVFMVIIPGSPVTYFQVQAGTAATNTSPTPPAPVTVRGADYDGTANPTEFVQIG
jgi:hypothetical protein